jgi:hypothetical protein
VPPLEAHDAVALFCDRAAALDASVSFRPGDHSTIGTICARLDGVPLAIELAAARSRSLGPAELLTRLDDRFRLLRGGGRGGLERHQTLRATVSWSYQLLDATERVLFDRLSVFAGGFDLPAVEAVCGLDPIDALDVVDLLGTLVDKSLVIADRTEGTTRYRLLETLRQYGEERLEERGETLLARGFHLTHYLGLARVAYELWLTERYAEGEAVFDREWDNLRVAHTTALATGDLRRAEAILDATYAPALHEQRADYLDWAQQTLGAARAAGRPRAATYGQAASFLFRLGDYNEAVEVATAGLEISPQEPRGSLLCLTYLLPTLSLQQRSADARVVGERLDRLLWTGTEPFVEAVAATTLLASSPLVGLASPTGHLERLDELATTTSAPPLQELAALSRGMVLVTHAPPDRAGALVAFQRGVEVARRTASATLAGANLAGVALCSVALGVATAADACREAIGHCYDARHWTLVWQSVGAAMLQLARSGEIEQATVIRGHLQAQSSRPIPLPEEDIEPLRAGPDADRWMARGAAMDRHELVRYALECLGPRPEAPPPVTTHGPGTANTVQPPI